jgi:hypothetical protein
MTPAYGFEYETPLTKPGITLTGDSDGSSPILAEQVETALAGIDARLAGTEGSISVLEAASPSDTGWLALGVTPAAGFIATLQLYRRWGPMTSIKIDLERTGAPITATSAGNIADTDACTITTVAARPDQDTYCLFNGSVTSGALRMTPAGVCTLVDMYPTSTIATNGPVRIVHTYFTATFN